MDLGPLVDTHCHLDHPALAADVAGVLARAAQAGVTNVVLAGTWPDGFAVMHNLVDSVPAAVRLHPALGLHPQALANVPADDDGPAVEALRRACRERRPIAIGECGLDYRVNLQRAPKARQRAVLRSQLELARQMRLPVLLHCLSAHEDLVREIDAVGGLPGGGVMHSYSGSAEQVELFTRRGLHLSFAGPITWPRARRPVAAAARCPAQFLLVETDAPFQPPEPHRHRANEPAWLPLVVIAVAAARGETPGQVARTSTANARALLRLP